MKDTQIRAWDRRLKIMTICDVFNGVFDCLLGHQDETDQALMQDTRSTDKKGKDLDWWEDDILEDEDGVKFKIVYLERLMRFGLLCIHDFPIENYYFIHEDYQTEELKKIGNIHEHPELLED